MLHTFGKFLQKMLEERHPEASVAAGELILQPHSFRTGHTTVGAVQEVAKSVKITLDTNN